MECRYPTGCHGPRCLNTLWLMDRLPTMMEILIVADISLDNSA